MLGNSQDRYGAIAIALHWLIALAVIGLAALGLWMVDLDYYDPWYQQAPDIHRSVGSILFFLILLRQLWRWLSPQPNALSTSELQSQVARFFQQAMLLLLVAIPIAGYLTSTADGRAIDVFGWFEIPAIYTALEGQEEIMGDMHFVLALILLGMASLHGLAALKHHFVDRDATLSRMLGRSSQRR